MTRLRQGDWIAELCLRLDGKHRIAVIGIGDELSQADRAGMAAAREIEAQDLPGVRVFLAGTVPESMTGPVKRFRPDHTLLLDAAEMGNPPGTASILDPGTISAALFSTHALPLPVVMDYLMHETGAPVTLLGIQPGMAHGYAGISEEKKRPDKAGKGEEDLFTKIVDGLVHVLSDGRRNCAV